MNETEANRGESTSGATSQPSAGDAALPSRAPDARVSKEDVTRQVDADRQQELQLQRQLEELQRERNELQDLSRKQDEFALGRKEMLERLGRCLVLLEHEQVETERRLDHIENARTSFRSYKDQLEAIREDQWNNANLKGELTTALAVVDSARNEFNHYRARLDVLDEKRNPDAAVVTGPLSEFVPGESPLSKLKFGELVKVGFALSLPVVALGIVVLIILAVR